jgi:hypothetical protein
MPQILVTWVSGTIGSFQPTVNGTIPLLQLKEQIFLDIYSEWTWGINLMALMLTRNRFPESNTQ